MFDWFCGSGGWGAGVGGVGDGWCVRDWEWVWTIQFQPFGCVRDCEWVWMIQFQRLVGKRFILLVDREQFQSGNGFISLNSISCLLREFKYWFKDFFIKKMEGWGGSLIIKAFILLENVLCWTIIKVAWSFLIERDPRWLYNFNLIKSAWILVKRPD